MKLREIAQRLGCELRGQGDIEITGVSGIDQAGPGQLSFIANRKYVSKAHVTRASALIVSSDFASLTIPSLRTQNPRLAFARAIEIFYQAPQPAPGIDVAARIAASAKIGPGAAIGPFVVIEEQAAIGRDSVIYPFAYLGRGVQIGDGFRAYAHVSVREYCRIGNNVILHDGAKIGADGFGYEKLGDGRYYKILQSGIVVLEDDVEVGANATIDRAAVGETRIRRGVKIDNLVQIGHASEVGEDTLLCGQVGLAGSTKIGRNCVLAGQVGVAGHLTIGDRVLAMAQAGIPRSIDADQQVSGYPAIDARTWLKASAIFKRLPDLLKRIEALEDKLS